VKEPRFDKTRDFGEVHPAGTDGIFYWQDGFPFCHEGKLVHQALTKEMKERLSRPVQASPKASGKGQTPALSYEQLKALAVLDMLTPEQKVEFTAMAPPSSDDSADNGENDDEKPGGEVNLELWLKGETNYAFFKVTDAVFKRYQKKCTRQDDLIQFLILADDGPKVLLAAQVAEKYQKYLDGVARN
jgi:hypothetical protein